MPVPLAPDKAFVVQVHAESARDTADLCGQVEHVASGRVGEFGSMEQLRSFMCAVLHGPKRRTPKRRTKQGTAT